MKDSGYIPFIERLDPTQRKAFREGMESLKRVFRETSCLKKTERKAPDGRYDEVYEEGARWIGEL